MFKMVKVWVFEESCVANVGRCVRVRFLRKSLLVDAFGERVHYMLVAVFQVKLFL